MAKRSRIGAAPWASRTIRNEAGREIRETRVSAGISLRTAAAAVGISHTQLGRIERAELTNVSVEQLCLACAAVGLRFAGRAYPNGDPVRDRAQLAVLGRFRALVPPTVLIRAEVPLPIERDARAWDLVLGLDPEPAAAEVESRLRDVQALQRRVELKQRDGGMGCVILVVNYTRGNRRALDFHRADLRTTFPLAGRDVIAAIRAGRTPAANGIVVL
jgi:transcriptional regulator with XRE-family HTH domain